MSHQAERARRTTAERVGQRFGRLTIVAHHSRARGYTCVCDCGATTIAKIYGLRTGRHQSCGCQPRKVQEGHRAAKNEILKRYRSAARIRGYSFTLSADEFFRLIERACHYCGHPPSAATHLKRHEEFRYSGVDRVNNSIGYVPGNCVSCCDICNNSKSTLTVEEWISWIKRVYDRQVGSL